MYYEQQVKKLTCESVLLRSACHELTVTTQSVPRLCFAKNSFAGQHVCVVAKFAGSPRSLTYTHHRAKGGVVLNVSGVHSRFVLLIPLDSKRHAINGLFYAQPFATAENCYLWGEVANQREGSIANWLKIAQTHDHAASTLVPLRPKADHWLLTCWVHSVDV